LLLKIGGLRELGKRVEQHFPGKKEILYQKSLLAEGKRKALRRWSGGRHWGMPGKILFKGKERPFHIEARILPSKRTQKKKKKKKKEIEKEANYSWGRLLTRGLETGKNVALENAIRKKRSVKEGSRSGNWGRRALKLSGKKGAS